MTNRICSLTVILDGTIREDDCECIVNAITMISGVQSVKKISTSSEFYVAKEQARCELINELFNLLNSNNSK